MYSLTNQDCPNLWDPSLELDLDTLWSVDLTDVDLGPAPAQQQDTIMTGTTDPIQQPIPRTKTRVQSQAQARTQTEGQNEADREWNIFIGQTMPDRVQLINQYNAQYHQSLCAQQLRLASQQISSSSSISTPTVSTKTPTPMNQIDKLLSAQYIPTPQSNQSPLRKEKLEKEVNALTRRLALEKDYLSERHDRLHFFSQCLASLREILQHERLKDVDKVGLEGWITDMAGLAHDLRVAIDGDEELIQDVEQRLRAVFSELGGFVGGPE